VAGEFIASVLEARAHDPLSINHAHVGVPAVLLMPKQPTGFMASLQLGMPATMSPGLNVAMRVFAEMEDIETKCDGHKAFY